MSLIRYRIDSDSKYVFHTFSQGQKFNTSVWLENDGRFTKGEDGAYATYYNSDGTIDTEKELELVTEEFNKDRKNNGTTYAKADGTEYLVSLTAEDANGLVSAKVGFDMGLVTNTNFVFSNGTIVPIASLDELLHLGAFVVTERNSFFVGVV